ncbi:MAG: hypothetical protein KJZ69_11195 [Phycisphaerales bacterium]|nr:hypothetical protein [Phycisphaerales bacterium]
MNSTTGASGLPTGLSTRQQARMPSGFLKIFHAAEWPDRAEDVHRIAEFLGHLRRVRKRAAAPLGKPAEAADARFASLQPPAVFRRPFVWKIGVQEEDHAGDLTPLLMRKALATPQSVRPDVVIQQVRAVAEHSLDSKVARPADCFTDSAFEGIRRHQSSGEVTEDLCELISAGAIDDTCTHS